MLLSVHIVPKSSKNEVVGWVKAADGKQALKVKIAAPPEEGKANEELLRFLAKTLGVSKTSVEIVSGHTSRHKRVSVPFDELPQTLIT